MFKESFKYYKLKWPIPDMSAVVDLDEETSMNELRKLSLSNELKVINLRPDLIPWHKWRCYEFKRHPGLIIIRNPFTAKGQRYWMIRCLRDYPKAPNVNNLKVKHFMTSVCDNWWQELQKCNEKAEAYKMKIALRWTTLGYHHDWDKKIYTEEMRTKFPADLAHLSVYFAQIFGFNNFNPEAAIVNYYPIGTTLAGHTDHSEINMDAPLFSFSFGQTAIFLIGGKTREEQPSAIFLRSGDVLMMSRAARLCYHAVPRIMKAEEIECWNEFNAYLNNDCEKLSNECSTDTALYEQLTDEIVWAPFRTYMNDSRININVRQVLHCGQKTL